MRTKKINAWAVVYSHETLSGSREDCLDSWFTSNRSAHKKLTEQRVRYPSSSDKNYLFICPVTVWQDDEYSHWHVKRAQV